MTRRKSALKGRAPGGAVRRRPGRGLEAGGAAGADAPAAPQHPCAVCASPHRRRIELRLFQGAAASQALAGLGRCGLVAADVCGHFESGHLVPDSRLIVASLLDLLGEAAQGSRATRGATLAAINQSHKLRLEVIKLIAGIASNSGGAGRGAAQPISMLLSDAQAGAMRKLAAGRNKERGRC